ncbi:MAG: FxsA family protein [Micrococcales bacterium]|nr:FxsA family protein [Micrococcales bacterium]
MSTAPRPRRSRLQPTRLALLGLVLLVLLEVLAARFIGGLIGALPTLLLLMALSALGLVVISRGGGRAWRALGQALQQGRMPARELADGIVVLVGGLLLVVPGFITALLGLLLVLPVTRPIARTLLEAGIAKRIVTSTAFPGGPSVTDRPAGPGGQTGPTRPTGPSQSTASDEVIEGEIIDDPPDGTN